jgi:mRNA interferase MazF
MVTRGDVWLATPDPVVGSEIKKTRPWLIVSPPEMHEELRTVIAVPLTTGGRPAIYRLQAKFRGVQGLILMDQIRTLDKRRLIRRLGSVDRATLSRASEILCEMFAP